MSPILIFLVSCAVGLIVGIPLTNWYCQRPATLRKWDRAMYIRWLNDPESDDFRRWYAQDHLDELERHEG